ncbi:bifunctional hydroxymethylpyrimidine kinase/phosphomethylpyrimidine kinase [bacterium]|nr:bifunctional hydroxymethylpyrimidine kinase/phosphomethylpyrimidine kinase [bacterium]
MNDNKREQLKKILNNFNKKKILVLGDLIGDEYIYGKTTRISREAPVLILKFESREVILGGGANSVNNIWSLGGKVFPVGVVGKDNIGSSLLQIMKDKKINTAGVFIDKIDPTITKTRIMAGGYHTAKQQVIRVDKEISNKLSRSIEDKILNFLKIKIPQINAILISDYGGVVTPRIIKWLIPYAKKLNKPVVVDSRFRVLDFKGVSLVTPNETEAGPSLGIKIKDKQSLLYAGEKLLSDLGCKGVLITRGKEGMSLFEKDGKVIHIPIVGSDEPVDVTGAGDTVASCITLALASGASFRDAAYLSNYAAGQVVMKRGTAVVTVGEISDCLESN